MELFQVKFPFELYFGGFAQMADPKLAYSVGRCLAKNTLVASDLFSCNVGIIPGIFVEEVQSLSTRQAFRMNSCVNHKS